MGPAAVNNGHIRLAAAVVVTFSCGGWFPAGKNTGMVTPNM